MLAIAYGCWAPVLVLAAGIAQAQVEETAPTVVVVPDLRGIAPDTAEQLGRLRHLEVEVGRLYVSPKRWRRDLEPRSIYLQTPQPGVKLTPGNRIIAWQLLPADEGQKVVETPLLVGSDAREAKGTLDKANLEVKYLRIRELKDPSSAPVEPFTVLEQYPRAGQKVYESTTILVSYYRPE